VNRAVAIAYVLHKSTFVFPLFGGRKVEHLVANLEALDIELTDEHIAYLESILPFNPGCPATYIVNIYPDIFVIPSA
jgi:aryl-alcohol dehydrogenase-like predicted oxidoreductase